MCCIVLASLGNYKELKIRGSAKEMETSLFGFKVYHLLNEASPMDGWNCRGRFELDNT